MFHREFTAVIGLPPSILAQAAAKACRALSCTIPELVMIDPTDPRADALHSLLDKVVTAYSKKKVAAKGRRTVARAEEREVAVPVVAAVQAVAPVVQAVPVAVQAVPVQAAPPLNLQGLTNVTPLISNLVISSAVSPPPASPPPASPAPPVVPPASPEPARSAEEDSTDADSAGTASESEDSQELQAMQRRQPPRAPVKPSRFYEARQAAPPARQKSRTATRWGL